MQKRLIFILLGIALFIFLTFTFQDEKKPIETEHVSQDSIPQQDPRIDEPTAKLPKNNQVQTSMPPNFGRELPKRMLTNDPSPQRYPKPSELLSHQALENSKWLIWQDMTAIPQKDFQGELSEIAGKASGYVFLENNRSQSTFENFRSDLPLVVYNSRLRQIGVVTGTVKIQLKQNVEIAQILSDYQAQLIGAFPEIQTYLITSESSPFQLMEFYSACKKDPRIKNADFEILSRRYEK